MAVRPSIGTDPDIPSMPHASRVAAVLLVAGDVLVAYVLAGVGALVESRIIGKVPLGPWVPGLLVFVWLAYSAVKVLRRAYASFKSRGGLVAALATGIFIGAMLGVVIRSLIEGQDIHLRTLEIALLFGAAYGCFIGLILGGMANDILGKKAPRRTA